MLDLQGCMRQRTIGSAQLNAQAGWPDNVLSQWTWNHNQSTACDLEPVLDGHQKFRHRGAYLYQIEQ